MTRVFGADEIAKRWKLYSVDAAPGTQEKGPDKEDISKFRWAAGVVWSHARLFPHSSAVMSTVWEWHDNVDQ